MYIYIITITIIYLPTIEVRCYLYLLFGLKNIKYHHHNYFLQFILAFPFLLGFPPLSLWLVGLYNSIHVFWYSWYQFDNFWTLHPLLCCELLTFYNWAPSMPSSFIAFTVGEPGKKKQYSPFCWFDS